MLERFTKEKQRASVRGGRQDLFNLGDDDDEGGEGLTHYGKSLGFDDFEGEGLGGGLEDEDENGQSRASYERQQKWETVLICRCWGCRSDRPGHREARSLRRV